MKPLRSYFILLFIFGCFPYSVFGDDFYSARVSRVLTSDIFVLESGETIRLVGVECSSFMADESKRNINVYLVKRNKRKARALSSHLIKNKDISIELIDDERGQPKKDEDGHTLAYLHLPLDSNQQLLDENEIEGLTLNEVLIQEGYCSSSANRVHELKKEFKEIENEAKSEKNGFWEFLMREPKS